MERSIKLFFVLLISIFLINSIFAVECPKGLVNDPYPGSCGLYTDQNKDGLCDLSQETTTSYTEEELHDIISGQDLKLKTVGEVAKIYGICETEYSYALSQKYGFVIKANDSFSTLHEKGVQPSVAKEIAESFLTKEIKLEPKYQKTKYNFILITIISTLVYLVSYFYFKSKEKIVLHKKIWNLLLLITFIITALTSLIYLLKLELGIETGISLSLISFWHIEIGLVMVLISIFHSIWHIPYFKSYLKN